MSIPPGEQVIKCSAYADRVADLARQDKNGPVIGFHFQNGSNQRWTFERQGRSPVYEISTIANGATSFAHAKARINEVIFGGNDPFPWVLESVGGSSFRIMVPEPPNGRPLYWTLRTDREETTVILESLNGDASQIWTISPL